jgi:hypothetical protein
MLSKIALKSMNMARPACLQKRLFTNHVGLSDAADILKTDVVVEFDQGLSEDQKQDLKRIDIYRTNPSDPEDIPKFVTYYID